MTDATFRVEVREFLKRELPEAMARRNRTAVHPTREDTLKWTAILARQGWSVPGWPVEYGGTGWSARQRYIFEEEAQLAGAPITNIQGVSLVGPVIYTYGTEAQKRRFLPEIRDGRSFWAQGFSEPNSGSDLASLRTRAVREGDFYVVNGQKIWTSQAMLADMLFCLVRTDPQAKPQRGISFLLMSLKAPGITIRPIRSIDEGESLCEVFFQDVRVPAENLVGEEGRGWDYAKFLLGNERVATAEVPRNKRNLALLKEIARRERSGEGTLMQDADFRRRIAELEIDLLTLEAGAARALDDEDGGDLLLPSVLKLCGCELMQSLLALQMEALGSYGAVYNVQEADRFGDAGEPQGPEHAVDVSAEFLFRRAATIYGGSNEVQKNIIAKNLLRTQHRSRETLTEEQLLLRESAVRFLGKNYAFEARRSMLREGAAAQARNWRSFAEMGWLGAAAAEDVGGLGGSAQDCALIAEEFGRHLVLEPFVGSAVLATEVLERTAGQRREALLAPLVAGTSLTALAHDEPGARGRIEQVSTRAVPDGGGFVLQGRKCLVLGGATAERFIVSARTAGATNDWHGISLFLVERDAPGLACKSYRLIDGQRAADLVLDDVKLGRDALLGTLDEAFPVLDQAIARATMMACADAVGAMDQALWITCDYLKVRRQFGSALAEFQALQHRLAEIYVEVEKSRSMLRYGLEALAAEPAPRALAVAAAKSRIGRSGFFVGAQGIQLHGGIGMTEEYVIGHYFKRLCVFNILFGNPQHHTQLYAASL